ncbi:Opi1-domain-containing protein [Obba rivulosa]|uniref:Opi1-domain-containing protein n=1 Tax=Obba rivulosa TaxID=1052685 RepID=A0A8E2ARR3_9APHY|nr:Opi1-domain-containing protein [Obba rivulosa]
MALTDEDESVRIAVRALGDMRNSARAPASTSFQPTPALSVTSGATSPSLPSPSLMGEDERRSGNAYEGKHEDAEGAGSPRRQTEDSDFVSRVSNIPIVNSAIRVYEQSKASSRVVKYGAEMMESSVKSISRPVIERLPVNQLDEFACRQLDRLETYTRRASSQERGRGRSRSRDNERDASRGRRDSRDVSMSRSGSRARSEHEWLEGEQERWGDGLSASSIQATQSRTPTPRSRPFPSFGQPPYTIARAPDPYPSHRLPGLSIQTLPSGAAVTATADAESHAAGNAESQQVAQRSRWQAMLLEAGGISAAVSDESMRRLRYCLQWLQYATSHIDAQILVLRNFIASLQTHPSSSSSNSSGTHISAHHLRTLNAAKRDVVDTLRQVVDVVSRYAGGALPEPARSRVRSFILCLPRRWAQAAGVDAMSSTSPTTPSTDPSSEGRMVGGADRGEGRRGSAGFAPYNYGPGEPGPPLHSRPASRTASRATSPSSRRAQSRQGSGSASTVPPTADAAGQAAQKILTLATESLDMLRGVTTIFKESLDRADAWVERLRIVGLQRGQNPDDPHAGQADPLLSYRDTLPPLQSPHQLSPTSSAPRSPVLPFAPMPPGTMTPMSHNSSASGYNTPYDNHFLSRNASVASGLSTFGYSDGPPSTGSAPVSLDSLSLSASSSAASSLVNSRLITPRSSLMSLTSDGELIGGGFGRGEKRVQRDGDDEDKAAVAAVALAGLAGSTNKNKRVRQEQWGRDDSRMDVDER